jgi:hypothetical protein
MGNMMKFLLKNMVEKNKKFVHEVRTFDRHLPVCGKIDQFEVIFICNLMQAVLANRWLIYTACKYHKNFRILLAIAKMAQFLSFFFLEKNAIF